MKNTIVRITAILLLLCMFTLSFFSCSNNELLETKPGSESSTDATQPSTSASTDTEKETDPAGIISFFKDGKYVAKMIRSDLASDTDKTLYNRLKAAFKAKTSKAVSNSTDFVASGSTLDNSAAILVGNTAYPESQDTMKSLKKGQAVAKIVNNKYVIAYYNNESLVMLLNKLEEKIANASSEEIVIDSTWNLSAQAAALDTYIKLPNFEGKSLGSAIDLGQGSDLYIVNNATKAKYDTYTTELVKLGFQLYTINNVADNEFSTFITENQIINVMFLKNSSEIRIIEDSRETIELPGIKSENVYTAKGQPSFTMMGISDAGYPGGMSFIYKLADGTFFIIDGGMCANRTGSNECKGDPSVNRLFKTLRELADDPDKIVISGWLITHIHNDHAGAFIDLAEKPEYTKYITIKKVIYSQPADSDMTDSNQPKRLNWMPDALKQLNLTPAVKAHPGQVFFFADLKLTILGCHDLVKPDKIARHNNASIVSMVEFGGKKTLFLADAEGASNEKLKTLYGSELDADIVQVAHHGYSNTNAGIVYQYVTPSIVLWPIQTSDWKSGDNVYNVSFNKTYFNKSGISHYVGGDANTTFENFSTWTPTRSNWKPS